MLKVLTFLGDILTYFSGIREFLQILEFVKFEFRSRLLAVWRDESFLGYLSLFLECNFSGMKLFWDEILL